MKKSVEHLTKGSKAEMQNSLSKARSERQLEDSKITQGGVSDRRENQLIICFSL